jgi:hypothetical protein
VDRRKGGKGIWEGRLWMPTQEESRDRFQTGKDSSSFGLKRVGERIEGVRVVRIQGGDISCRWHISETDRWCWE